MPVVQFPANFEREIKAVAQDGNGYRVKFACGHDVWFAIDVTGWRTAHCSHCFDQYRKAAFAHA